MNDRPLSAAHADDDWLDAALRAEGREHRAQYLDDAGFTARVMAALPAPVQALPAWRRPALTLLWALAGLGIALALPGAVVDVTYDVMRVVVGQRVSLSGIGAAVVGTRRGHLGSGGPRVARRLNVPISPKQTAARRGRLLALPSFAQGSPGYSFSTKMTSISATYFSPSAAYFHSLTPSMTVRSNTRGGSDDWMTTS